MVREFAGDPRVETFVMSLGEPRLALSTFWTNLYLRGRMLFDENGAMGNGAYLQPDTAGVPASRTFVIGPDQTVAFPFFGHDPGRVIDKIHELLGDVAGDFDADHDVDDDDFDVFSPCFTGPGGYIDPSCGPGDFDGDDDVDCGDWYRFVQAWTEPHDPPEIGLFPQTLTLSVGRSGLSWTPVPGAGGYDVVQGDLQMLRDGAGDYAGALGGCVVDDHGETTLPYTIDPANGVGSWLLVRGVAGSTTMTYDTLTDSQVGGRDPGIESAPTACP